MARPTRQGLSTALVGVVALGVGRVFGILELYILAAALFLLPVGSWVLLVLTPSRLTCARRLHPRLVEAGDEGTVRVDIQNASSLPSPVVTLHEPIGSMNSATIEVGRLKAQNSIAAIYHVPTERRGVVTVGPMSLTRRDPLRLASRRRVVAPTDKLTVTPRTLALGTPSDRSGPLGTRLRAVSQRLGQGEFHSLRDYVPGDELRSIHWKASARSDELKVKQHDRQSIERCTVILDVNAAPYQADRDGGASFERAVSCAASAVAAAHHADLNTRFVAGPGVDHRGPDVLADTLTSLAPIEPINTTRGGSDAPPTGNDRRDHAPHWIPTVLEPGDGLGLIVVVSATTATARQLVPQTQGPGNLQLFVCVSQADQSWNSLDATTLGQFQQSWNRLVGHPASSTHAGVSTSEPPSRGSHDGNDDGDGADDGLAGADLAGTTGRGSDQRGQS